MVTWPSRNWQRKELLGNERGAVAASTTIREFIGLEHRRLSGRSDGIELGEIVELWLMADGGKKIISFHHFISSAKMKKREDADSVSTIIRGLYTCVYVYENVYVYNLIHYVSIASRII